MENLIDYMITTLCCNNSMELCADDSNSPKMWTICFGGNVYLTFNRHDISVIRDIYEKRRLIMFADERDGYEKLFKLCV